MLSAYAGLRRMIVSSADDIVAACVNFERKSKRCPKQGEVPSESPLPTPCARLILRFLGALSGLKNTTGKSYRDVASWGLWFTLLSLITPGVSRNECFSDRSQISGDAGTNRCRLGPLIGRQLFKSMESSWSYLEKARYWSMDDTKSGTIIYFL